MQVDVDTSAGFCFGVVQAIETAEQHLEKHGKLFSLGQMVHNEEELNRLADRGLHIINSHDFPDMEGQKVLLRAHGEPPKTYQDAEKYGVTLMDATCPIVLKLQQRIRNEAETAQQVVIFGKYNHPETIGLNGQTGNTAIIIESIRDIEKIDFSRDVVLYAQTTMDTDAFEKVEKSIAARMVPGARMKSHNTICGQMKRRKPALRAFVKQYDVVLFVAGRKSSNGRFLYEVAHKENRNTYHIGSAADVKGEWLKGAERIGISGATSTPRWLMQQVANHVKSLMQQDVS